MKLNNVRSFVALCVLVVSSFAAAAPAFAQVDESNFELLNGAASLPAGFPRTFKATPVGKQHGEWKLMKVYGDNLPVETYLLPDNELRRMDPLNLFARVRDRFSGKFFKASANRQAYNKENPIGTALVATTGFVATMNPNPGLGGPKERGHIPAPAAQFFPEGDKPIRREVWTSCFGTYVVLVWQAERYPWCLNGLSGFPVQVLRYREKVPSPTPTQKPCQAPPKSTPAPPCEPGWTTGAPQQIAMAPAINPASFAPALRGNGGGLGIAEGVAVYFTYQRVRKIQDQPKPPAGGKDGPTNPPPGSGTITKPKPDTTSPPNPDQYANPVNGANANGVKNGAPSTQNANDPVYTTGGNGPAVAPPPPGGK